MASYLDFDLLLLRGNDRYHARVLNSPAGQASLAFRLPFGEAELDEFFKLLGYQQPAFLLLTAPTKAIRLSARTFGARLFEAVFRDAVGECLRRSLDAAEREGAGLRLRLRLTDVPDLAALPWEYLYDPLNNRFFVLSNQRSLVRYLELPSSEKPLEVTRPLRILMVIAIPRNFPPLDIEQEWHNIKEALSELEGRGLVVVERLQRATRSALQNQLRQGEYHILHFVGHGVFDHYTQSGGLVLENGKGLADVVPAAVLGTLLGDHRPLRLVLLNACEGARGGQYTPFAGTAQHLIQQGLPAVMAMQSVISDKVALVLTHEFYRTLADGYPVDAALAEARKAMFSQRGGSTSARGAEWAVPTLFMRAPDGKLFEIEGVDQESPAPGTPPFKGLRYFEEQDSLRFFGRERLTAELVAHLRTHRFLAVVGASGSGKSSLVRAGIIPALKRGQALPPLPFADQHDELPDGAQPPSGETRPPAGSTTWPIHIITPTNQPLKALAASLTREVESVSATATLIDDLKQDARSLDLYASKLLSQDSQQDGAQRLLLVVDQFEELFTLCRDNAARQAFVDNLMQAVVTDSVTMLIIALRADFYAHCSRFDALRQALETKQKYIGPMSADELRRAIEKPAEQGQWHVQAGLADLLLKEVEEEPGALPLLSHALLETWTRRQGRTLTFAGYYASGGVKGAIAHTAERVFQQELNAEQQEIARFVFLRLTELGEGTQDTRRRVELSELIADSQKQAMIEGVIHKLADARLITTDSPTHSASSEQTLAPPTEKQVVHLEVAHEALIREWPTLRQWLDEDREGLRIHRSLTEAMQEWQTLNRDPDALYRGVRLSQALEWATENLKELNAEERHFLEASQEFAERIKAEQEAQRQRELEQAQALAKEAEARRKVERKRAQEAEDATKRVQRRNMWVMAFGIAALLLALVAGLFYVQAEDQRKEAEDQRIVAEHQRKEAEHQTKIATVRQLAAESQTLIGVAPQRSLLQALEALNLSEQVDQPLAAPENALREALANTGGIGLSGHKARINAVSISPDNHWLVTGSLDGTARLWDLTRPDPESNSIVLAGHQDRISAVSISPDNHWLVTASFDGTAHLWDLTKADPSTDPIILAGHEDQIWTVSISSDNHWLVTGSMDNTARLWDLTKANPSTDPIVLEGHRSVISAVSISSDNHWLVTGSHDGTARLWDLTKADPESNPIVLEGYQGLISAVSISSDNHWLVTGGYDGAPRLWDLTRLDSSTEPIVLKGHQYSISTVSISPDSQWLVTGSLDNTARLWDLTKADSSTDPIVLEGHGDTITAVSISPDNDWLVTGSQDNTARLWDLTKADPSTDPIVLAGHEDLIWTVSISSDNHLVTGSRDNTARLWDLTKVDPSTEPIVFAGHQDEIWTVSISPDNHWLVTGSFDGTAHLWDLTNANPSTDPFVLADHESLIHAMSISSDNHWLATGSFDGTARLWDLTKADPSTDPIILAGHKNQVWSVSISPDNNWVVTGSRDGTARLWDLTKADPSAAPIVLEGHRSVISAVSISSDNQWLVTGSDDGTARLWDLTKPDPESDSIVLAGHQSWVNAVSISSDNHWLVTGSLDNTARLWDLTKEDPSTDPVVLAGHQDDISAVSISADNHWLVTGSLDNTARLWDLTKEDPSTDPVVLAGHEDPINAVSISPDNHWLVTGSADKTARLWDLTRADPSAEPAVLVGHEYPIRAVSISSDNHWVVTGSDDETARLWNLRLHELRELACRTAGRNLTEKEWDQYFKSQPYRKTCPNFPVHYTVIDAIREEGRELAKAGKIDCATAKFEEALALDPSLKLEAEAEAKKIAAEALVEHGKALAREGKIDGAIAKFEEALALDPSLKLEAEVEAKKIATEALVEDGIGLAWEGKIEDALAKFSEAKALSSEQVIDARDLNALCWYGSLWERAADVLDDCERAVELAPHDGNFRHSRGLARALTGDYVRAIEDFQFYVEWTNKNDWPEEARAQQKAWIERLQAGENPFDAETLDALRNQ